MMREPVQPQTHNPALEREKKNPEQTQQPRNQQPNQPATEPMLENPSTAQVEVLLEQIAHDMTYENKLKPEQQQLLAKFGYSDGGLIDGPFGFEMRSFVPSKPEYPNPILAFRGTEFSKIKDLVADLEPQSVGLQQFNANRRRIELELQKLSKRGKVWLTGHSLGGALAQLAGSEFADLTGRIITFQSPGIDAKHVAQLKKHNKANPDKAVQSTHYQVAGDVVSGAGEALTPGELVRFEMNPSSGATMKQYAVGIIAGAVVGPGTGVVVKEAADKVSKHRAFPVTNAVQENPAFQDLFENGKKFDKVAGISDDTFKAKATLNADTFQNTRVSEFLRHTLGKQSFEIEHAVSDWGGDAKAREFAERYKQNIPQFTATQLLEQLSNLLNGWVSDDDVQAFETICYGVSDPKIMSEIYGAISPRLEELHSDHQRKWVEDAINFKPVAKPVQRKQASIQRDALNSQPADSSSQQIQNLSGGNLLRSNQRKELEDHFGVELGDVRLHTDEGAQKLAKDLNAKAATIGEHIVLAESSSLTDKELIGHEVAHVIQQRSGKVGTGIDPDSGLESEAKLEGKNFAAGAKTRGKKAMLEPKKAFLGDSIQRETAQKTPVTITFSGQSAKEVTFKPYTRGMLEEIMRKAGVSSCTITSTTRTPHDQARIFYQQLTGQLASAAYAAPGEAVKAVGKQAIKDKKTRDEAIALMEAKIQTFDPMSQVSKHLADPNVLNVFDVAPNSISSKQQQAFVDAVTSDTRVSKFLHPGNSTDPAYHIEVPQSGGTQPTTPAPVPTQTPNAPNATIQREANTPKTSTPTLKSSSEPVQREADAKKTTTPWNRDFTGSADGTNLQMQLFRTSEGTLTGTYHLENQSPVMVEGKVLNTEDNDLFLKGTDGSKWHGKYTTQNTLMFGNVELPKRNLKNLEMKSVTPVPQTPAPQAKIPDQQTPTPQASTPRMPMPKTPAPTPQTPEGSSEKWTREFNGMLGGKYDIHMHLERDGTKLSGSYYYTKQGASNAIALTGVIDEKTKVVKLEGNGEIFTGAFMGEKGDRLEGNWIGGDKNLKFSVKSSDLTNTKSTNLLDLTGLKGSQLIIARIFNTHGSQLVQLCNQIGVNPGVFAAIIATESQGTASSGGQMLIRFEVHKFFESWGVNNQKLFNQHFDFRRSGATYKGHKFSVDGKNWTTLHPTGTPSDLPLQYQALDLAKSLGTNAVEPANACLGMGLGQVQGFNYQSLGFKSASEMFDTLSSDESEQVKSVFSYVNARPKCLKAMQSQNWNNIELYYNGGGQNGLYADAMKNYFGLLSNLAAIQKIDLATGKKVGV